MKHKNIKKIAIVALSLVITMQAEASVSLAQEEPEAQTAVFSDVDLGNSHYIAIKYLKDQGLIDGYADGSFQPGKDINRAEALKMIMGSIAPVDTDTQTGGGTIADALEDISAKEASDQSTFDIIENPAVEFNDVRPGEWFYPYVIDAYEKGIVAGYPDGLFHPENVINRVESLKIALLQENLPLPEFVFEPPYSDVMPEDWFAPYAQVSKERNLILRNRTDDGLDPEATMNRGEFAELIYRMIKSRDGSMFARTTWYGFDDVNWGTASGEKFDTNLPTAAHKTLPFGTLLLVKNLANGKTVIVKVNDRGPVAAGMDLDLTSSAFEQIASLGAGIIVTEFEIVNDELPNSEPSYVTEYGF